MATESADVFFYGLFMDESLLASRGIRPHGATMGYIDDYVLRIGQRATLLPERGGRVHGVLMTLRDRDVHALYSEDSVADYRPQPVSVVLPDGALRPAACYILPAEQLEGSNTAYADALLRLATALQFPENYLQQIKRAASR